MTNHTNEPFTASMYGTAPRSDDATRESISAQAVREAWRAAITLGNNICVQESDDYNRNDETRECNAASGCAKRIREFVEPADELLVEMLTEAGASNALAAIQSAPAPREAAQDHQADECGRPMTYWGGKGPAPQQREGAKKWPFVESPGEFTERLRAAITKFSPDLLAAVRNVFIESPHPPAVVAPLRPVTDEDVDAAVAAYIRVSGEQGSAGGFLAALESFRSRLAGESAT